MGREIDLERISEGDVIVVRIEKELESGAFVRTDGVSITVSGCEVSPGEYTRVEVIDLDREGQEILGVPADRTPLYEEYNVGDTLTVSVDEVTGDHAYVDLGPGRTLKITDYKHQSEEVDVVITRCETDYIECKRLICVGELSLSTLVELNQEPPCPVTIETGVTKSKLNVITSHLLACSNWSMLEKFFEEQSGLETVDLSIAMTILEQQSDVSPDIWKEILYTATKEIQFLIPSIGAEFLGSVLREQQYPKAWKERVQGNLARLQEDHGVAIKHSDVQLPDDIISEETVTNRVLYIRSRESETRDYSINKRIRQEWDERCAICGNLAVSRHDKTGIEGSHIYPVQYGGPDTPGNILPMCRNDHWAFENGWISISDDYAVLFHSDMPEGVIELLQVEEGDNLFLIEGYEPDQDYLALHRRIHGFEPIEQGQRYPVKISGITVYGASVTFPDGTQITIPVETLNQADETQLLTVVITDVSGDRITAVPIIQE